MLAEAREEIRLFVCQIGDDEGMSLGSSLVLQEEISLMGIPSSKMREVGSFCQTIFLDGGILFTWNDNNFSFVEKAEGVQNPFPRENACLFDGKRLVLAAFENWDDMAVRLVVYNREGQLYCGSYRSSQDGEFFGDEPGILPQGARIWEPNSAWTMKAGDGIVTAFKFKWTKRKIDVTFVMVKTGGAVVLAPPVFMHSHMQRKLIFHRFFFAVHYAQSALC